MSFTDLTRNYTYSYSGADAQAWVYYPGGGEDLISQLDALHTISASVHEAKGQARALGYRGIKGLARGVRTIAGSMILTVIEDNPLRPLMDMLSKLGPDNVQRWPGWSLDRDSIGTGTVLSPFDYTNRLAPLLPPFNMMVTYVSEGATYAPQWDSMDNNGLPIGGVSTAVNAIIPGASWLLENVEFIDEGIVTSVNDIVSEVALSFIATNMKPISRHDFTAAGQFLAPVDPILSEANSLAGELASQRLEAEQREADLDSWWDHRRVSE